MSDQQPSLWDHVRKGMAEVGHYLPVPIVSGLLQAPERYHEQTQFENMQQAAEQLGRPGVEAPAQPQAQPRQPVPGPPAPAVKVPPMAGKPGMGQSLLTGAPMQASPPNTGTPLTANTHPGQPISGSGGEMGQSPPVPQGKPSGSTDKFRKKFLDSFTPDTMKYLDPHQKQEIYALKGMSDLSDGNWMGAADQMVRAGMDAPQALSFAQNMKGQKQLDQFQKSLLDGFNPTKGADTPHASQENFLSAGMRKALTIKDPKARAQAVQMVTGIAKGLPKQSQIDQESSAAAVQRIRNAITPDSSPQDIHSMLADEVSHLPASARPIFTKMVSPVVNQERSMAKDELGRQVARFQAQSMPYTRNMNASQMMDWWGQNSSRMPGSMLTRLEPWVETQITKKLKMEGIAGGDALKLYSTLLKNPNVQQVLKTQPYWKRLNSTYRDAMSGNPMAQVPFMETYVRMFSDQAIRQYLMTKNIDVQSLTQKMLGQIQKVKDGGAGFTKASLHQMFQVAQDANTANRATIMPFVNAFRKAAKQAGPDVSSRFDAMTEGMTGSSSDHSSMVGKKITLPGGKIGTIVGVEN